MRSGVCTLQQTLTSEAASILKHSLLLARRRGHAQVTPLHVAATLLTLRSSSLKTACLKSSQSQTPPSQYPLQCRALELCFNVALNRLPTTPGGSLLVTQQPSLSNALIAALKRAQAHQRRGCIEQQQQQPLLTIKVELDQLIISILDDPSVSRVMREAGFSSTAVKNNIEDSSVSPPSVFHSGLFSSPSSPSHNPLFFSPQKKLVLPVYPITTTTESYSQSFKEDVKVVLDVILRKKKKNTVIVGDSVSLTEGLVGELVRKLERGEVPDELKSTLFIKFQLANVSLRFMKRDEVEMNILQLKRKVDSIGGLGGGGAIFYVGDLKWTVDDASLNEKEVGEVSGYVYNPVEHIVAEIGKLFCDSNNTNNNNNKVWLLATASYQTYMRCQMRQPSLETHWGLQAVPVPSGGLGLTLHANSSVHDSKMMISQNPSPVMESKLFSNNKEEQDKLICCEECTSSYEKEAQLFQPDQNKLLPSWLQSHSTDTHQKDELTQLKKKWNRLCHCLHQNKQPQNQYRSNQSSNTVKIYPYNSSYPWWPNQAAAATTTNIFQDSSSITFADSFAKPAYSSNNVPRFRRQQSSTIEFNFNDVTQKNQPTTTTTLDSLKSMEGNNNEVKITLALGNSTFSGSGQKKVEKNITNRTLVGAHISKLLQENVPWQSETLASIAEALVAKESSSSAPTWLFLQGNDSIGKTRLALSIAESVFGSVDVLLHLDFLKRENSKTPFSEMVAKALTNHEKIVLLVENVDFADTQFRKLLADGFETAKFATLKDEKNSCQAIFILTNGSTENNEDQNKDSVMKLVLQISEKKPNLDSSSSSPCLSHKRRAELDLFTKIKNPRIEEKEEGVLVSNQRWCKKKDFSRQSSFNTLDLNMKADEEDDDVEEENSPISSDLTRETIVEIDSIENKFEFNKSPIKEKEMKEMFLSRMKKSFEEVFGVGKFNVEERVIEEIGGGCGYFTNRMFEKWLKDIFQTSLLESCSYSGGGKVGIVFTLCWGGKEYTKWDSNGFMGTCLPKNVQLVNYFVD